MVFTLSIYSLKVVSIYSLKVVSFLEKNIAIINNDVTD